MNNTDRHLALHGKERNVEKLLDARPRSAVIVLAAFLFTTILTFSSLSDAAMDNDGFNALYFPPHKITQRTVDEVVHYAGITPVNAVVLHVKTPQGKLMWASENALAIQLGVTAKHSRLAKHVNRLKAHQIHTIAKLDVFADHRLAATLPNLSVMAKSADLPWSDANGLHWSNPADARVWDYNFGLTAWKKDDFGVGQVLEKMSPHLDVICPMFYPSHFPSGFLGKQSPGEFPEIIVEASLRSMMHRTDKPIRPWIQGFWYRPKQIGAQFDGIENANGGSWSIWNPTGRYAVSYQSMAICYAAI